MRTSLSAAPTGLFLTGQQALRWDGRDELGRPVANGVYFVELLAGAARARERLIVDR